MSVTFCGHGDIYYDSDIKQSLQKEIETAIKHDETEFLLGGYGNFDLLAATVLKNLKSKYPQIKSTLVTPYIDKKYDTNLYDESIYPPLENVPKKFAIIKRNEWTVDKSNLVIAYVKYNWGGASRTLNYAVKKRKNIVNLANQNTNI